ncbi:MAG: chondroitinase family polysaccharide lyase [Armatimonadota bacterium]|jgi:chondroitin-sulfate-ABC endolyase/exolyase
MRCRGDFGHRLFVALLIGLVLCGGPAVAQDGPLFDSFDEGVPGNWVPSRDGMLSTSDLHYKHGTQSLRWDFQPGDTIHVDADLGDVGRYGGYGGTYSKATFGVWLYCREPMEGSLRFDFRTDDETDAWFEFPLDFSGWRRAHLKYTIAPHQNLAGGPNDIEFVGRVRPATNTIAISAPAGVDAGTVFIDLVVYNGLLDYRRQHLPSDYSWAPVRPDPQLFPLPGQVSEAQSEGVEYIGERLDRMVGGTGSVSEERIASLREQVEALNVVRDEHGIRGQPVVHSRWMEFYAGIEGVTPASVVADLMLALARAWHGAEEWNAREEIADWYCLLAEHLRDQGMIAGSGFSWGWYDGRNLGEANYLMRAPLRERGLLDWAASYLDYSYGFSRIFDDGTIRPNMDYFHMDVRYRLYGCLMQVEPVEQVRHMDAYSRRLSLDILTEDHSDGYKPDGSAYHHQFHYFAYAGLGTRSLVNIVEPISHTPFRLSTEAMERLKTVALAMRFYCNLRDLPLPLAGRHPFSQSFDPRVLRTLARCGTPDGSLEIDPDLAAAYLRFVPEDAAEEEFAERGIAPETLAGNMTMNYAGLTAHRRDDWLALAKGYSRYVRFGEIYANNNRFGRYLSNGYLDILAGGDPISREGSGVVQDGWDWNRLDGTTVIYLPLEDLRAVSSGTESIRSDQTFVGGLTHRGWNGAFVMQLQGGDQHEPTFRGRKTYFFFDDRIVCLGSEIVNEDSEHPTQTNLFQKHLPDPDADPTWFNGEALTGLDVWQDGPFDAPSWVIDPQGTGYWLPAGQSVHLARLHQRSRNQSNTEDTEGHFATGWIDHGAAPDAASYEYAVIVRSGPERMRQFTAAMEDADERPYEVLQRDARAHVVFDRASASWGAVVFEATQLDTRMPLVEVDRACLVMIEQGDDGLQMSVADPDLNLQENLSVPRVLRLLVRGQWEIANRSESFRVVERIGDGTVIDVICHEGRSYDLELTPAG